MFIIQAVVGWVYYIKRWYKCFVHDLYIIIIIIMILTYINIY